VSSACLCVVEHYTVTVICCIYTII